LVAGEIDAIEHLRKGDLAGNLTLSGPILAVALEAMSMRSPSDPDPSEKSRKPGRPPSREDRLKAALKANMARRKAQAKARTAEDAAGETADKD
jgi:hypothetical protein